MYYKIYCLLSDKFKFKLNLIIFLSVITFFFEFVSLAALPIFISFIIDPKILINKLNSYYFEISILENINHSDIINFLGMFVLVIFLLKNFFLIFLVYFQSKFFKDLKIYFSTELFYNYVHSSYLFHLKKKPSELTRNISDDIDGLTLYLSNIISLIKELMTMLVIFIFLIFLSPLITLIVSFFFFLTFFIYNKKIKPLIKEKSKRNQKLRSYIIQLIYETFGSIKDLKIKNKESDVINYFNNKKILFEDDILYFSFFERIPRLVLEIIAIFFIVLMTLFLLNLNNNFFYFAPILSLLVLVTLRFIPAFNSINLSITYLKIYETSVTAIINIFKNINYLIFDGDKNNIEKINYRNNQLTLKYKNFLYLDNICFSYPDSHKLILKNISAIIEKGSKIGITGKTGSGKSTLFHLMLGLYKPSVGNIFYKNISIYENLKLWRNQIGYVSQNIYLLNNSIKKNITFDFLDKEVDKKKLEKAIHIANLSEKINQMPNGVDTNVGNEGLKLSGGERQRIAIARAVYKEPNIFFLDESTSALDTITEDIIMENINKNFKNKTIIIIAHRKTSIDKCDKIWNIKDGSLEVNK
jgi:ABC-type multidrug transport system fused ATPase/permease subunit